MTSWSFLTNHARALIFIAAHPDTRLRDLAAALDVTERTAFVIVADLVAGGHILKERDGRRNRYHVQADLPVADPVARHRTVGELLELLLDAESRSRRSDQAASAAPAEPGSPQGQERP